MCQRCTTPKTPAEILAHAVNHVRHSIHVMHSAADRARAHNDAATAERADELAAKLARAIRGSAAV